MCVRGKEEKCKRRGVRSKAMATIVVTKSDYFNVTK